MSPAATYDARELDEAVDIEPGHRKRILDLFYGLSSLNHYELLGVARSADKKAVKRAYFELAQLFHPDKYFRKNLGSYKSKMEACFGRLTVAHDVLTGKKRADYDAYLVSVEATRGVEAENNSLEAMLKAAMAEVQKAEEAASAESGGAIGSMSAEGVPPGTIPTLLVRPKSAPPGPPPRAPAADVTPPPRPASAAPAPTPTSAPAPVAPPPRARMTSNPEFISALLNDSLGTAGTSVNASAIPVPTAPATPTPATPPPAAPAAPSARDALARRMLGGRAPNRPLTGVPGKGASAGAQSPRGTGAPPAGGTAVPAHMRMSASDAVESLKRRYQERVGGARQAQIDKYLMAARQAVVDNDPVAAANAYRVASALLPDDEELKHKAEEAQSAADHILYDSYLKQADYEEKNAQWGDAARSWSKVAKTRPDNAMAHERAANALVKANGNLHEAAKLALKAVALEPKNLAFKLTLANVYMAADLLLNARRELEAALALSPGDKEIQALLKRAQKS